jgi:hypothetical protein
VIAVVVSGRITDIWAPEREIRTIAKLAIFAPTKTRYIVKKICISIKLPLIP